MNILAAAIALSIVCVAIRIQMIFYVPETLPDAKWIIFSGLRNSYFDMAVVWSTATVCLVLLWLTSRTAQLGSAIAQCYCYFAVVSVLFACINVVAVNMIGGSLTFQWIYYADLLHSFTSRSAIRPALNGYFYAMMGLSLVIWLIIYLASRITLKLLERSALLLPVLFFTSFLLGSYFVRLSDNLNVSEGDWVYITNPLLELATTAMAAPATELLRVEDVILQPQLPPPTTSPDLLPAGLERGSIHNIVLIVMESVGAQYVAGTGPKEAVKWTPRIASYDSSTLAFRNIYAHVPHSTKSLFSLLTSLYPRFSFEGETSRFEGIALQTLSTRLKDAGFRTSFFMSGDFGFQSVDKFLEGRGFDLRSDMRTIPCTIHKYGSSTSDWPNSDIVDDSCAAEALKGWIDAASGQAFFAIMWTGNTHWPYFSARLPAPGALADDPHQNRYLSAVQSSDAAIGDILDHLARRGLRESTLVVVIGDHGEAFGEHGYRFHANTIYEEETRIPLLLINPQISGPGTNNTLGGMIDIAPTILHVLGLPPEATWSGRSIFDPKRPDCVFLFAPNQEMVAGYRQGSHKFVYRVARNKALVYDLIDDPAEMRNVADERSATVIRRRLAGWLQEQDRRLKALAP